MRRERWLILTFVPALVLLNAFVVLNYTGLSYQPFSWQAFAGGYTPDGGSCMDPADCASGNCVNDVCCDTPCLGANQTCETGTCTSRAPAPALSGTGLLIGAALLAGIGALGLLRRRRDDA